MKLAVVVSEQEREALQIGAQLFDAEDVCGHLDRSCDERRTARQFGPSGRMFRMRVRSWWATANPKREGCIDKRQVAESLREVAEHRAGDGVDLLGE